MPPILAASAKNKVIKNFLWSGDQAQPEPSRIDLKFVTIVSDFPQEVEVFLRERISWDRDGETWK
jgi:hypothetical protein